MSLFDLLPSDIIKHQLCYLSPDELSKHPLFKDYYQDPYFRHYYLTQRFKSRSKAALHFVPYHVIQRICQTHQPDPDVKEKWQKHYEEHVKKRYEDRITDMINDDDDAIQDDPEYVNDSFCESMKQEIKHQFMTPTLLYNNHPISDISFGGYLNQYVDFFNRNGPFRFYEHESFDNFLIDILPHVLDYFLFKVDICQGDLFVFDIDNLGLNNYISADYYYHRFSDMLKVYLNGNMCFSKMVYVNDIIQNYKLVLPTTNNQSIDYYQAIHMPEQKLDKLDFERYYNFEQYLDEILLNMKFDETALETYFTHNNNRIMMFLTFSDDIDDTYTLARQFIIKNINNLCFYWDDGVHVTGQLYDSKYYDCADDGQDYT